MFSNTAVSEVCLLLDHIMISNGISLLPSFGFCNRHVEYFFIGLFAICQDFLFFQFFVSFYDGVTCFLVPSFKMSVYIFVCKLSEM